MRELRVVLPDADRIGGTQRAVREQVARWRTRFTVELVTTGEEGRDRITVPGGRGPHLMRYVWWLIANRWARRGRSKGLTLSAGVNALDADVVSLHKITRPRATVASEGMARRLHRRVYALLSARVERCVLGGPATVWALSRRDARFVEDISSRPEGTVPVVPHGVDANRFASVHRTRGRRLLLIGNDVHDKGIDIAVEAMDELADATLTVVTSDPAAAGIACASSAGDRIEVVEPRADIEVFYSQADVLVAPSRFETFGLCVLEAMACGLPVIVGRGAGVADLLCDGRDAIVLEDPHDLAAATRALLADPDRMIQLATAGRTRAAELSWDSSADAAARLIEREASLPRMLVLSPRWGDGGIQRAVGSMLTSLAELIGGERIVNLWLGDVEPDVTKTRLMRGGATRASYALRALLTARRWRRRLTVVAAHPNLAPLARVCARVTGAPYHVWCYGREVWGPVPRHVRAAVRRADRVLSPSDFTATQIARTIGRNDVDVVPLAVEPLAVEPLGERERGQPGSRVVAVATLTEDHTYKGVDRLLEAWPAVLARCPDATLEVCGDGDERHRLAEMATANGLGSSVSFPGRLTDEELGRRLAAADLFALPSRARTGPGAEGEGFGIAWIEAALAELPVVAARAGAIPEVVRDGVTGTLVDPHDTDALAEAITALLLDPARAREMGRAGRHRALELYSRDAFTRRLAEVLGVRCES